jgi:long-chain fatty acid transport protein
MNLSRTTLALLLLSSSSAFASDFFLPTINASGLGTAYAGWTAEASDASTGFSNPAGLTRIDHPEILVTGIAVKGRAQIKGTTTLGSGKSNTSIGGFIPSYYFSQPLTSRLVFGFGTATPFALGTYYGKDSLVRYSATLSRITVMDLVPSIGFKINDQWSVGAGLDFERLGYLSHLMVQGTSPDSESQNHLYSWGYGWHAGVLYQLSPQSRFGFSVNSPVVFHAVGTSTFFTPGPTYHNGHLRANTTLPGFAQVGFAHDISPRTTLLGTVFYTHWSTLQKFTMQNVSTPAGYMNISVPFNYHDTFDYSLGLNFKATEYLILKTGVQLMNKPSNNRDRNVSDTTNNSTLIAFGAHYQHSKKMALDVGYAHNFIKDARVRQSTPAASINGKATTSDDILGVQATWDLS